MQVRVEVLPWLSELVGGGTPRKAVLRVTLGEGEPLRVLLQQLQQLHPRLGEAIFDPRTQRLTGRAEVAINGVIHDLAGGLDAELHDGDVITLLPGIAGGLDAKGSPSALPPPA